MLRKLKILLIIFTVLLISLCGLLYYRFIYYPSLGIAGLTTRPDGAKVYLEGGIIGATPLQIMKKAGKYKIVLEKDEYQKYEGEVEIKAGEQNVFGFALKKK